MEQPRCTICHKPLDSAAEIGATCKRHQGHLREFANSADKAPEGYIRMSTVCKLAVEAGLTIGAVVNAAGGDAAANNPPLSEDFRAVYVGRGKWLPPSVLTAGFALLKQTREAKTAQPATPKEKKAPAKSKDDVKAALTAKVHEVK